MIRKLLIGAAALAVVSMSSNAFAGTYSLGSLNPDNGDSVSLTANVKTGAVGTNFADYYTFTLTGEGVISAQAGVSGAAHPDQNHFFLSLYSGTVGHGTLLGTDAIIVTPGNITDTLAPYTEAAGAYYVEVSGVSKGNLTISGGVATSAVPELSTWAMLGLGFAGLGFVGSRKRGARIAA